MQKYRSYSRWFYMNFYYSNVEIISPGIFRVANVLTISLRSWSYCVPYGSFINKFFTVLILTSWRKKRLLFFSISQGQSTVANLKNHALTNWSKTLLILSDFTSKCHTYRFLYISKMFAVSCAKQFPNIHNDSQYHQTIPRQTKIREKPFSSDIFMIL